VTALGVERAHLLGWAFGNRVARAASQNHPDRVETVTLLAAGGLVPPAEAVAAAFRQLGEPGQADSTRLRLRRESPYAPISDIVAIQSSIRPGSWPEARTAQLSTNSGAQVDRLWSGGEALLETPRLFAGRPRSRIPSR
jgi:pimeloyl-ACP methyl ester carboxylesterase